MKQKQNVFPSESIDVQTGCGSMYVHMLYTDKDRNNLTKIKASLGKSGGCARSHLESKVAFINSILESSNKGIKCQYCNNSIKLASLAIKTLTDASGHRCQHEDSCHNLLIRLVIDELMKVKI